MADPTNEATGAPAEAQAPATGQAPQTLTLTAEELDKRIQSETDRRVAQAAETVRRKEAEKAATMKAAAEREALEKAGEVEKLRALHDAELTKARQELHAERVNNALQAEALKGATSIHDVSDLRLLDPQLVAECSDADGKIQPEKVQKAIAALRESKPYLFQTGQAQGQAAPAKGAPSPGTGAPASPLTTDLTPEEYMRARVANAASKKNLMAPSRDAWLESAILNKTRQ